MYVRTILYRLSRLYFYIHACTFLLTIVIKEEAMNLRGSSEGTWEEFEWERGEIEVMQYKTWL